MKTKVFFLFLMLLLVAGCTTLQNESDNNSIKIGFIAPLTGDAASIGQDSLVATQLAVDEVNEAGGIDGKMLDLIVEDGKCNAKDAANAANKLINIDGVKFINGGLCSGETLAAAPLAEVNQVVMFSGCSSAPTVSDAGDFIFRSYPSDNFQGKFAAEYIYDVLGVRKVAILTVLVDWGVGIRESFVKRFTELGGEIVISEDMTQDSRDVRTQLTKIKNTNAELLYYLAYTENSLAGLRQIRELGIKLQLLGGDAWADTKIHENDFADNIMYVTPKAEYPEDFVSKMEERGGHATICAPGAYNNIKIFADIMKRVGTDSVAVKNELYNLVDFPGVVGPITLDQNGDPLNVSYDVWVVEDKKSMLKQ